MKIIELYNRIANNEDIPQLIKWNKKIYEKFLIGDEYMSITGGELFFKNIDTSVLNEEVEILDLDKLNLIEPLCLTHEKNIKGNYKWRIYGEERYYNIAKPYKIMADKINEIIKKINNMEGK